MGLEWLEVAKVCNFHGLLEKYSLVPGFLILGIYYGPSLDT